MSVLDPDAGRALMIDVLISSAAEADYTDALCWYVERSIDAAEQFEAEFQRSLKAIASGPERFPFCDDRHRFFLLRRFPFQVIYRPYLDRIVIVAVAHTSREPRYWEGR